MKTEMAIWSKEKLENYFHNYITYLTIVSIITKDIATIIEKNKEDIINNILKRNLPGKHYPFIIVAEQKPYCVIDIDSGFDLRDKKPEEANIIINSRGRHRLKHEEVMAVEKSHELELLILERDENLATKLSLRTQWISRGSYAEIIELN